MDVILDGVAEFLAFFFVRALSDVFHLGTFWKVSDAAVHNLFDLFLFKATARN